MTTYRIHKRVTLGAGSIIEDFSIIGAPPRDSLDGELETTIGEGAVIRSHTVIYAGNVIGTNFQTGNKVNIRESNRIGNNVSIGTLSVVEHHVEIGDNVRIHTQAFIPEFTVLQEGCWIGPHVVLTNAKYPLAPKAKDQLAGPVIGKWAKIGANTTVLPGVVDWRQCAGRCRFRGGEGRPGRRRRRRQPGANHSTHLRAAVCHPSKTV